MVIKGKKIEEIAEMQVNEVISFIGNGGEYNGGNWAVDYEKITLSQMIEIVKIFPVLYIHVIGSKVYSLLMTNEYLQEIVNALYAYELREDVRTVVLRKVIQLYPNLTFKSPSVDTTKQPHSGKTQIKSRPKTKEELIGEMSDEKLSFFVTENYDTMNFNEWVAVLRKNSVHYGKFMRYTLSIRWTKEVVDLLIKGINLFERENFAKSSMIKEIKFIRPDLFYQTQAELASIKEYPITGNESDSDKDTLLFFRKIFIKGYNAATNK